MDKSPMTVAVTQPRDGVTVVRVAGEIGLSALLGAGNEFAEGDNALDQALRPHLAKPPKLLVVDLTGASFLCSLGIGTLMRARKHFTTTGADIRLAATGQMITLLKLGRLDQLLPVFPTVEQAIGG